MPTVTDLLQVATKRLYQGVTDTGMGFFFFFCWGYGLCFILFCPCPFSLSEKSLVGLLEQSHNPELRSTSKNRQILLGGDSGEPFCPCAVYEEDFIFCLFVGFFSDLDFVFVPPRMEKKTCRFGVM